MYNAPAEFHVDLFVQSLDLRAQHASAASVAAVYAVIDGTSPTMALNVIGVRVTHSVRAKALHYARVSPPVQGPVQHVMIAGVVNTTMLTSTLLGTVSAQGLEEQSVLLSHRHRGLADLRRFHIVRIKAEELNDGHESDLLVAC